MLHLLLRPRLLARLHAINVLCAYMLLQALRTACSPLAALYAAKVRTVVGDLVRAAQATLLLDEAVLA